ncbi:hypothetical protein CROQUDRAFT_513410 [Cronartium quercuum f. sp. fusiforme G11]|uniref:Charged multivesicular body protein 6 n=1 Tax=Cronartium quercuum f. sp. fusiforme G11 TaxID=708437 RepID=A0A9P6N5J0_9BASI|nr:hypothetical protein CROQUDRAFT_513410 [Cronartium quercuum f. sp. fusiforme G11]
MGQTSSSGHRITPQDRAILDMKLQRDRLKQYQKKIEVIANQECKIAKDALANGNKSKALLALRRKKYQETLLSKTDLQLETLQNLVSTVEFTLIEKDVLYGLKQGNEVLKEIHKEMNLDSVEKLMSDTAEAVAYQREIDGLMMSKMSADEEEDVQRELAILQAQETAKIEEQSPTTIGLPDVPQTRLPETAEPAYNQPAQQSRQSLPKEEAQEAMLA